MTSNDELELQRFGEWFEREWRQLLIELETPAMQQRQLMQMAWYGWQTRSKQEQIDGETDVPH